MKKLLYITDQEEYSEHGTIGALFHGYLKEHLHVNVVYFTKYKHSFQVKGDDFIAPEHYNTDIINYLQSKGIEIGQYHFVFVRNTQHILKAVLDNRDKYGYKVGFRTSFAKSTEAYEHAKLSNAGFFKTLRVKFGNFTKDRLINKVDIFLPTTTQMQRVFYPNITCKVYPLLTALDPKQLTVRSVRNDGVRRFIYMGTLDILREFEVVLDAFNNLSDKSWHLTLSVYNPETINELLKVYPRIKDKVEVLYADELTEIKKQVCRCDVGLALLPNKELYNNALSAKVVDYYTCAVPALLSDNSKNRSIFEEDTEAYFSSFDVKEIESKLKMLIEADEASLIEVGETGQKKLLELERNYEVMAQKLSQELDSL
ncbi:MAG: glycosyltransferase [Campylobacterota bacterium]|nr:glycosyltransferase [Campylobacterota bacterium]